MVIIIKLQVEEISDFHWIFMLLQFCPVILLLDETIIRIKVVILKRLFMADKFFEVKSLKVFSADKMQI